MGLGHAKDIERVEPRRKALDNVVFVVKELQRTAPIGPPEGRHVEDIGNGASVGRVAVVMDGQKMPRLKAGGVTIGVEPTFKACNVA